EEFEMLRNEGIKMGFKHVESGPLVRSSYHAKMQSELVV
ncbi:MAG TPA: lipoyl synthase, partial [Candidatus Wujingus californicus]